MKTPQGKDCYTVYINYLKDTYNTNEFLLCKETLKIYAVINGLALETDLFTRNEPIDLDKLHDYLTEVISRKQTECQRQSSMDLEDRTNLIKSRTSTYCNLIKKTVGIQQHHQLKSTQLATI